MHVFCLILQNIAFNHTNLLCFKTKIHQRYQNHGKIYLFSKTTQHKMHTSISFVFVHKCCMIYTINSCIWIYWWYLNTPYYLHTLCSLNILLSATMHIFNQISCLKLYKFLKCHNLVNFNARTFIQSEFYMYFAQSCKI